MKIGFDNDKYLAMQSAHIRERIAQFDNKLYLEFGGKLFDDYHASRVLPGFQPDSKMKVLLQLKEQEYIQACRIDGGSSLRIILKHLFPNCIPMLIVSCTLGIPSAILTEASLSYLGLGVPSPTASWGSMISGAQTFIRTNTYYSLFPGLCIILTVIAFNTLGDGLRDVLDPKLRK